MTGSAPPRPRSAAAPERSTTATRCLRLPVFAPKAPRGAQLLFPPTTRPRRGEQGELVLRQRHRAVRLSAPHHRAPHASSGSIGTRTGFERELKRKLATSDPRHRSLPEKGACSVSRARRFPLDRVRPAV